MKATQTELWRIFVATSLFGTSLAFFSALAKGHPEYLFFGPVLLSAALGILFRKTLLFALVGPVIIWLLVILYSASRPSFLAGEADRHESPPARHC